MIFKNDFKAGFSTTTFVPDGKALWTQVGNVATSFALGTSVRATANPPYTKEVEVACNLDFFNVSSRLTTCIMFIHAEAVTRKEEELPSIMMSCL